MCAAILKIGINFNFKFNQQSNLETFLQSSVLQNGGVYVHDNVNEDVEHDRDEIIKTSVIAHLTQHLVSRSFNPYKNWIV